MKHIALCVLLLACAHIAQAQDQDESEKEPKKPIFTIVASPRQQIMPITNPVWVRLVITIENADEEMWCPFIHIEWGDGDATGRESDCDPYEEADMDDIAFKSFTYRHRYRMAGRMTIVVRLIKNDDVIKRGTTDVTLLQ